jgi:hypothetical protein
MSEIKIAVLKRCSPRRLNKGVDHHGRQSSTGLRAPNAEIQLRGDRGRPDSTGNIDHPLVAVFTIRPRDTSRNGLLETKQCLSSFLANHRTNVAPNKYPASPTVKLRTAWLR